MMWKNLFLGYRVYLLTFAFLLALFVVYKVSLVGFYLVGFLAASVVITILVLEPSVGWKRVCYAYLLSLAAANVFLIVSEGA